MRPSIIAAVLLGCVPYQNVAKLTVAETCSKPAVITKLRGWAFQVDACGQTTYVRCSGSFNACCWPTSREEATAMFAPERFDVENTCVNKDPCSVTRIFGPAGTSFAYVDSSICS
jgi:hypothetical protein